MRGQALGEPRRFAQQFGVQPLIDRASRRFGELGLRHATFSDEPRLETLSVKPLLLRMPLVPQQSLLPVGDAKAARGLNERDMAQLSVSGGRWSSTPTPPSPTSP